MILQQKLVLILKTKVDKIDLTKYVLCFKNSL